MAQLKAAKISNYISNPDKSYILNLFYGPDQGLVSENADKLITSLRGDDNNPLSLLRMELDDIASDPGKLSDEAFAISMFGDDKIIRIAGTTRKNIKPALQPILDTSPVNCWIIIEAGDLKRDSALRKLVEGSANGLAMPCFQDSATMLDQLIHEELSSNNLKIDQETTSYLRSYLGEDRRASRNELKKLALYAHGQDRVSREQIMHLLGNVSVVANNDIIDATCLGKTGFLAEKYDRLMHSGGAPDILMLAALRQFQMLHKFRTQMDHKNMPAVSLISSARPPIHYMRRDTIARALKLWTTQKIENALQRLNHAFFEARSKPSLGKSIAATALLALAIQATRR